MTGERVTVTPRQEEVLRLIRTAGDRGLMVWMIRDRVYPADSPMRTHRPNHHGKNGAVGGLGNLQIGRVCANLSRKNLIHHRGRDSTGFVSYAYVLAPAGRRVLEDLDRVESP